jgi:carbonic anhydrase/acetyltransferase-like protein (isoleucine patch superfamily)
VELNPVLIVVGMGLVGLLGWWRVFPHLRSLQTTETSRDGVMLALIGYIVMTLVVWALAGQLEGASLVRLMTLQALASLLGVGAMLILAGRRRAGLSALGLRSHRGPPAPLVAVFAWMAFFPIFYVILWLNQSVLGGMGVELEPQRNLQRFLTEDGARTSVMAWFAMIAVRRHAARAAPDRGHVDLGAAVRLHARGRLHGADGGARIRAGVPVRMHGQPERALPVPRPAQRPHPAARQPLPRLLLMTDTPHLARVGEAFIANTAVVCGDVTLAKDVSVWYGAIVRGDCAPLSIGELTNVQDGVIVHADTDVPNDIGAGCTIGHGAVVHGRRVGDNCLIGIKAVILGNSEIGDGCIIAAGAVVREGSIIPPRSLVAGVPGKIVRQVTDDELAMFASHARTYLELATSHLRD